MSNTSTKKSPSGPKNLASDGKRSHSNEVNSERASQDDQREDFQVLCDEVGSSLNRYCRKRPMVAHLAVFAAGLYIGWKIKPW